MTPTTCQARSSEYCSWLGAGSSLLLSVPPGQVSHDAKVRGETSPAQPSDINISLGSSLGFHGNRHLLLQGHRPRSGLQCWHRLRTPMAIGHGPRWHHWLLTSGSSSLPSSVHFCLWSPVLVPISFCFPFSSISLPLTCSS